MLMVFLLGFGIAISLLYGASFVWAHPIIVLGLASIGLAALILYGRKMVPAMVTVEIRNKRGEREYNVMSRLQALVRSAAVGVLVYILMSFIFVATFGTLSVVSPWTIFGNASAMGTEATKVALALVASWCIFWLWFTKKTDSRWLFWTVSGVSTLALVGMSTVGYFTSKNPEDGQRRAALGELNREKVMRLIEAYSASKGFDLGNKANRMAALDVDDYDRVTIPAVEQMPWGLNVYTATFTMYRDKSSPTGLWTVYPEAELEAEDGIVYLLVSVEGVEDKIWYIRKDEAESFLDKKKQSSVDRFRAFGKLHEMEKPEAGSQWNIHWLIDLVGANSKMKYIQLVRRDDENVVRFMKQDYLDELLSPPAKEVRVAVVAEPETEVVTAAMVLNQPRLVGDSRTVDEDLVNINGNEWVETEIVPGDGDRITIFGSDGKPMLAENLKKIQIRAGMLGLGEVTPEYCSDGQHAIGATIMEGKNSPRLMPDGTVRRLHVRLKMSKPGEMTVLIRRSKGY